MDAIPFAEVRKQLGTLQIAERIFDSAVLYALFELGVFELIADGPKSLSDMSGDIPGCNEETLRAVLDAGVALDILTLDDHGYGADQGIVDCLGRPDSVAYMGEWVAFLHALAGPLLKLDEAVETGRPPGALFEDMSSDDLPARRMTKAMDAYARSRGVELAKKFDFSRAATMLDFGAGPGTYSMAVLDEHPQISVTAVDLEGPIAEARRIAEARGYDSSRLELLAADGRTWEPKRQWDLVLISNTLHMIGEAGSRSLLRRAFDWVNPGGTILVQAQYLNDDRVSPRWPTLLNLIQRVATPDGRNHTIGETREWIEAAGFQNVEYRKLSLWNVNALLVGDRPTA